MRSWTRWFRRSAESEVLPPAPAVPVQHMERLGPGLPVKIAAANDDVPNVYSTNLDLVKKMIAAEPQGAQVLTQPQRIQKADMRNPIVAYRSVWKDEVWHDDWQNNGYYFGFPATITKMMYYIWRTTLSYTFRAGLDVDNKMIVHMQVPPNKAGFFLLDNLDIKVTEKNVVSARIELPRDPYNRSAFIGFQMQFHWD